MQRADHGLAEPRAALVQPRQARRVAHVCRVHHGDVRHGVRHAARPPIAPWPPHHGGPQRLGAPRRAAGAQRGRHVHGVARLRDQLQHPRERLAVVGGGGWGGAPGRGRRRAWRGHRLRHAGEQLLGRRSGIEQPGDCRLHGAHAVEETESTSQMRLAVAGCGWVVVRGWPLALARRESLPAGFPDDPAAVGSGAGPARGVRGGDTCETAELPGTVRTQARQPAPHHGVGGLVAPRAPSRRWT